MEKEEIDKWQQFSKKQISINRSGINLECKMGDF